MYKTLTLLLFMCSALFCSAQINYSESFAEIQNPERGFYAPINGVASSFTPLTASQLTGLRTNPYTPWQGNYTVSPTIIFRHYVLDIFKSSNLSSSFLNGVQTDFNAARAAGVKLLLRFSYTITPPTGNCGSWICPPYGDAPKSVVLSHIAQLKPYLQGNSDVILAVQNGFIGVWGEQYYTDHFGDASIQGRLTDQNWQDRIDVVAALLDAVPSNRMVQVRYAQMKQKFIYGIKAPVTSAAMTSSQAYNGTNIARIGFHNDCFLSAPDDQGTYMDYGTSTTSASNQTSILKPYSAEDSKYVVVGGETCSDAFSPQNDCSGQAVSDMDYLNYSYLNAEYNNEVNNDWQTGGCMAEIKRRFGYRLVMRSGNFPNSVTLGSNLAFTLSVSNVGFAAPFNPKQLNLVLRNTSTGQVYKAAITGTDADIRFWLSGQTVTLNKSLALPSNIVAGTYELLLHVSDMSSTAIASRPEYSVQMANVGTWEASTGFNKLNKTITVSSSTSTPSAPTNLTASAGSSTSIRLSWSASSGASSYRVYRSTTNGGPYTWIATGLTSTGWNNTGLSPQTTYYYIVRAVNSSGISSPSNQAIATTFATTATTIVIDGNSGEWSSIPAITTNGTGGISTIKAANSATYLYVLATGSSISSNYQLYLDTDNNNTDANEYKGSAWPSSGFNYMIENGSLYRYSGTGTDWAWTNVSNVTASKNTGVMELRIPISSIGPLASTIRLAAASINSSWTTVGYAPAAGGSGAPFVLGSSGAARSSAEGSSIVVLEAYPNPASSTLHVKYQLETSGYASLDLYNLVGQKIKNVFSGVKDAGEGETSIDVRTLKGFYLIKLKSSNGIKTKTVRIE